MTIRLGLAVLALLLAGCGTKEAASDQQAKHYPMQGEIKSLDPSAKTASIAAGKIGNWMDAMTMEYPIKPDSEFSKLHTGDHIQATVVVGEKYYVTDIKVVPPGK